MTMTKAFLRVLIPEKLDYETKENILSYIRAVSSDLRDKGFLTLPTKPHYTNKTYYNCVRGPNLP